MHGEAPHTGMESSAATHPIGVVSRRTGISLHVLRAWERRYGVVLPTRTPGGQRLYSDADVQRLILLRQVTEAGRSISRVAGLPVEELQRMVLEDTRLAVGKVRRPPLSDGRWRYVDRCLAAAEKLDGEVVHGMLMRAVVSLRPMEFLDEVLMPLLREVGEEWHCGRLSPAQEHGVSEAARRVVLWLVAAYEAPESGPLLLVTTPSGEQHEFGALMVTVIGLDAGWRISYLGTSLPPEEIVKAAGLVEASVVALSLVNGERVAGSIEEIRRVRRELPVSVPVVVGGAAAVAAQVELESAGVIVLDSAAPFAEMLRRLAAGEAGAG